MSLGLPSCRFCGVGSTWLRDHGRGSVAGPHEVDDLLRLAALAAEAEAELFERHPRGSGHHVGRLLGRALCRYPADPPRYIGRRVDLLGRSLPVAPGTDPARAIRDYLAAGRTTSARALAAKAAVLIDPAHRAGEIVWPTDSRAR
jgi:hypothetical protein